MPSRWDDESLVDVPVPPRPRDARDQRRKQRRHGANNVSRHTKSPSIAITPSLEAHDRSAKRRKLPQSLIEASDTQEVVPGADLLRFQNKTWRPSRTIDRFQRLNPIEEGSYGFVSRAREEETGRVVAIKKLKLDSATDGGFPVTALREIQCLSAATHDHVIRLCEVVVGQGIDQGAVYLVMDFLEHDLKTLQETMLTPFMPSEVKTLLLQLGSAVDYLHDHWILHRDLKTSNILMNNRGEIKLADFGMARFCGDPCPESLTQLVVTLWYRAPELLLGTTTYNSAIDLWSVGCIFPELLLNAPLLQGKTEIDQLRKIITLCGIPTTETWPDFRSLPNASSLRLLPKQQPSTFEKLMQAKIPGLTACGVDLLSKLLSLNPARRVSAKDLLKHPYFEEEPRPKPASMFPSFPSKANQERRKRPQSPSAPMRGAAPRLEGDIDLSAISDS